MSIVYGSIAFADTSKLMQWGGYFAVPNSLTQYVYYSNQCSSEAKTPIQNAINTWNSASPTSMSFSLRPTINLYSYNPSSPVDGFNTIGTPLPYSVFSVIANSSTAVMCNTFQATLSNSKWKITEFDILYNMSYTFGVNTSTSLPYDWQGLFTHELGHSFGLADLAYWDNTVSTIPTMYGGASFIYGMNYYDNITYYYRTLTSYDTTGKSEAYSYSGL
jgi:hypothetical protein